MFRFTIRDLLWLMVVVGLSLGWWIDHSRNSAPSLWEYEYGKYSAKAMAGMGNRGWELVSVTDSGTAYFKRRKE